MKKIICAEAKQIDLVDYLASLGHYPQKVRNQDHWYLSPLREEKTPSFKINRRLNVWYDHGTGKGGNLVDFGTLYFKCSVSELLQRLQQRQPGHHDLSFHQQPNSDKQQQIPAANAGEKKENPDGKIVILDTRPLADQYLIKYLQKRCIPRGIADRFCKEVDFLLYGKKHTVIGFQNNAGGYELRCETFKGSNAPKEVTFIDNRAEQISVFEGFFSFLSFQIITLQQSTPLTNFLVLNSLSFFEKCRPLMEQHKYVQLFLDRDSAGISQTQLVLQQDKKKFIDRSDLYHKQKDLNDWLVHNNHSLKASQRIERHL